MEDMSLQMGGLYRLSWRMMNRILSPRDLIFPAGSVDFPVLAEVCLILRNNLAGQVGSSIFAHLWNIMFLNPFILRILSALQWSGIPLPLSFSINSAIKAILATTYLGLSFLRPLQCPGAAAIGVLSLAQALPGRFSPRLLAKSNSASIFAYFFGPFK